MIMSDIGFSGLGSFALFLFISCFFGLLIFLLAVRFTLLNTEKPSNAGKINGIWLKAALIPFFMAIAGLVALSVFNGNLKLYQIFDQYLAIAMVCAGIFLGIVYLIMGYRKLN